MHKILKEHGTVILTFDDGRPGIYEHARHIMQRESVPGTVFVIGSWAESGEGMKGWQIYNLYHDCAWDVFSHTWDHTKMIYNTADYNEVMLDRNLKWLRGLGIDQPEFFAYPWGLYSDDVIKSVSKFHTHARAVFRENRVHESWPFFRPFSISAQPFSSQENEQLANLKVHIDAAERDKTILFVYIHDIKKIADRLSCSPEQLEELIAYCKSVKVNMLNFTGLLNLAGMGS